MIVRVTLTSRKLCTCCNIGYHSPLCSSYDKSHCVIWSFITITTWLTYFNEICFEFEHEWVGFWKRIWPWAGCSYSTCGSGLQLNTHWRYRWHWSISSTRWRYVKHTSTSSNKHLSTCRSNGIWNMNSRRCYWCRLSCIESTWNVSSYIIVSTQRWPVDINGSGPSCKRWTSWLTYGWCTVCWWWRQLRWTSRDKISE